MAEPLVENVSDTAFWIAHYRAVENERPDALFRDPLAGVLAGERGQRIAASMPRGFMTGWAVVIRTHIIDDFIRYALSQGVDTVLNLGAGLDTRPYRMDLPASLLWLEADYPAMIEYKEKKLVGQTPRCKLERMKLDLSNPAERKGMLEAARARSKKLLVLTEGVIPYLTLEQAAPLADDLYALEPACFWIVDYFAPEIYKYRKRMTRKHLKNAPFQFNPGDWFGFFAQHGWRLKEIRYFAEEGERLKRPMQLTPILRALFAVRRAVASAKRREQFRRYAGYVLLERGAHSQG
jgi:methyltransferase (TIGR00027 family)